MSSSADNTYIIDPESAAEMARLVDQDRAFNENMETLAPPEVEEMLVEPGKHVLDVACGPGGWARDLALQYPHCVVTGVDISRTMIRYARAQAKVEQRANVSFSLMDVTHPLDFADGSFDFVNARLLGGILLEQQWQGVVDELVRITRPGGFVRLTEMDSDTFAITNSPNVQAFKVLATRATAMTKRLTVITPRVRHWMAQAGCRSLASQAYMLNFSSGERAHATIRENLTFSFKLLQPFVIKGAGVSQQEVDRLYENVLLDMQGEEFYGAWYYLSTWGQKPE